MKIWTTRLLLGAMVLAMTALPVDIAVASDGSVAVATACAEAQTGDSATLQNQGCRPMDGWVCVLVHGPVMLVFLDKCNVGAPGCGGDGPEDGGGAPN